MSSARRPAARALLAVAVGAAVAAGITVAPASATTTTTGVTSTSAGSTVSATRSTPSTVTAQALPTWQIDGVVWDTVTVGNVVYATGQFDHARPPGTKTTSTQRVARHNLLAFDITTGVITEFSHTLNAPGLRITASPDGKTVYVGGRFTKVDGKRRVRLAAFDVATGDLVKSFHPTVNGYVRALAATNGSVYAGGDFTSANGKSRGHLARFTASGSLTGWRPSVGQGTVFALAVLPGGSRVAVGGSFQRMNSHARVGIGAVSASTGATRVWKSRPVPARIGPRDSYVSDLIVSGGTVYATNVGDGGHWFDGRWAARASDGTLVWLDNCYGATLSGYVTGNVFYSVGHAHDCSALGAFTEQRPKKRHYQALAETTYATRTDRTAPSKNSNYRHTATPTLLHWYPTLGPGHFTGRHQAAWAITGNGTYVALAGEFVTVNGVKQQGLTRFAIRAVDPAGSAPKWSKAMSPSLKTAKGRVTVTWTETWDREDSTLTYTVQHRVAGTTTWSTVATKKASSLPWKTKKLSVTDKGTTKGTAYQYRVTVRDPAGNSWPTHASASVTAK